MSPFPRHRVHLLLKSYSHPSIQALLKAEGGDNAEFAIRRRARALVAEATAMKWTGPPFDMTELASLRSLRVSESFDLAADQDACVMPGQVLVNQHKPRVRRRYSLAHEVAHTLFPDYEEELRRVGRLWRREGDDSVLERLCQVGAAELLMPLEAFETACTTHRRTILGALALKQLFDASIDATIRRMIETAEFPMAAAFLRPRDPTINQWIEVDRSDGHRPHDPLGVSLFCANAACGEIYVVHGTVPPSKGAADRAWKRVSLARGQIVVERRTSESWEHADIEGNWASEAITLPEGAAVPHQVVCLLRRISH